MWIISASRDRYWVCTIVAVVTVAFGLLALGAVRSLAQVAFLAMVSGIVFLFYYLGGIGVREGSRFAAAVVFVMYALDMVAYLMAIANGNGLVSLFVAPGSVIVLLVKTAVTVVLFCNLRATWVAASWTPGSEESALPGPSRRDLERQVCGSMAKMDLAEDSDSLLCFRSAGAGALVPGQHPGRCGAAAPVEGIRARVLELQKQKPLFDFAQGRLCSQRARTRMGHTGWFRVES